MLCTFELTVWELEQQSENVAFPKKDDEGWNSVVMKQQDTTFTQMTIEVAITAIFQGLGYTQVTEELVVWFIAVERVFFLF